MIWRGTKEPEWGAFSMEEEEKEEEEQNENSTKNERQQ